MNKKYSAFSLVEMLMALLVASILLAAFAPVMTRRMDENVGIQGLGKYERLDYAKAYYEDKEWPVPAGVNVIKITAVGGGGAGGSATYGYKKFNYTGGVQNFTVPNGVTKIRVYAIAGGGGGSAGGDGTSTAYGNIPSIPANTETTFTTAGSYTFADGVTPPDTYKAPALNQNCRNSGGTNWTLVSDNSTQLVPYAKINKIGVNGKVNVTLSKVTACGAGGGGGGTVLGIHYGAGGGSGGYIANQSLSTTAFANSINLRIGSGGGAGSGNYSATTAVSSTGGTAGSGYGSANGTAGGGGYSTGTTNWHYNGGGGGGGGSTTILNGSSQIFQVGGGGGGGGLAFTFVSTNNYATGGAGGNGGGAGAGCGGGGCYAQTSGYVASGGGGGGGRSSGTCTAGGNGTASSAGAGGVYGGGLGLRLTYAGDGVLKNGYANYAPGGAAGNYYGSDYSGNSTFGGGGGGGVNGVGGSAGTYASSASASGIGGKISSSIFPVVSNCSGGNSGSAGKPGAMKLWYSAAGVTNGLKCTYYVKTNAGAGGGAGQIWLGEINVTPKETLSVNVGKGGNGASAKNGNGLNGGNTVISGSKTGSIITLLGGSGGIYSASGSTGGVSGGCSTQKPWKNWTGLNVFDLSNQTNLSNIGNGIAGGKAADNNFAGGKGGQTYSIENKVLEGGNGGAGNSNGNAPASASYGTGGGGGGGNANVAINTAGLGGNGGNGYVYIEWGEGSGGGGQSGQVVIDNNVWVSGGVSKVKMIIGKGGAPKQDTSVNWSGLLGVKGNKGGDTIIMVDNEVVLTAKGGYGGNPGILNHGTGGGRGQGETETILNSKAGDDGENENGGAGGSLTQDIFPLLGTVDKITSAGGLGGSISTSGEGKAGSGYGAGGGGGIFLNNRAYQGGKGSNGMVYIEYKN